MNYSIRQASSKDYEALNELFTELDRFHRRALPHLFQEPPGPARSVEFLSGITTGEDSVVFLAEDEGLPTGFIHVVVREAPPIPILKPRRFAVIESLYVRESTRRMGIGRKLVETGCQWAASKAASDIELNVWEFNQAAIAFYATLGFTAASRKMTVSLK